MSEPTEQPAAPDLADQIAAKLLIHPDKMWDKARAEFASVIRAELAASPELQEVREILYGLQWQYAPERATEAYLLIKRIVGEKP